MRWTRKCKPIRFTLRNDSIASVDRLNHCFIEDEAYSILTDPDVKMGECVVEPTVQLSVTVAI